MIRFGSYNICNGWNGRIESVVRGMSQANIDLGIFQETKVAGGGFTQESPEGTRSRRPRHRSCIAEALPSSTNRWRISSLRHSTSTDRTFSGYSWIQDGRGGISGGAILPLTTP